MTNSPAVLILASDEHLAGEADRVAAAVGLQPVRSDTPTRKLWLTAAAVVVDEAAAHRCIDAGLPRRPAVVLVASDSPARSAWSVAVEIGAQHVWGLPRQEAELVRCLAEAAEAGSAAVGAGRVIAVTGARGGAGSSMFAAALAICAEQALLMDLDPCSAGLDLVLGAESSAGLRWPDLDTGGGRLTWTAIRDALPRQRDVTLLSSTRAFHEIDAAAAISVLGAARRSGVTVICDVPRHLTAAAVCAAEQADLVCVVTPCDVRGIGGAAVVTGVLRALNPNVGVVVRGPSPGGLVPADAAAVTSAPLLAAMRAEPHLARQVEDGGLRLRPRSALARAARTVLALVSQSPEVAVA